MKTNKTSSRKTPSQKAKERLAEFQGATNHPASAVEESKATKSAESTVGSAASPSPATAITVTAPAFKEWRITTFADLPKVDEWFQDKLIYILAHLLRKARILKRKLIEFTFPEKGIVRIVWQDIATGEIIHEGGATGGVVTDEEDPLS